MILDDRFVYQHRRIYITLYNKRNIYLKIKYRENITKNGNQSYYSYFLKINKLLYKIYKKSE